MESKSSLQYARSSAACLLPEIRLGARYATKHGLACLLC